MASAAPTANYGLDVHIDTGFLGLSMGGVQSLAQDVLITPVWMGLVWVVHALCVMLEWCFTLDLLDSSAAGGLGGALRQMQSALTQPWLATVLSIACVLVLYDGLVRRRVAETLGQALLMLSMIVAGMWAIADPSGTVGALGRWANEASLGTLAVAARGTPEHSARSLGESMQTVFAAAIEAPWCYLEFGNVGWCRETGRLDPALRAAGLKIASNELSAAGCNGSSGAPAACTSASGAQAAAVEHSAELLRTAQSNGAIFLALPPNGPARNSINDEGSLLRTLCGSSDATACRAATAGEAEFRTGGETLARMAGLLMIVLGALGMILLLGFIALRLLGAALFSLLFLLMAPGMVLAPALGNGGRAVFRRWLAQLLGAVVAKLLFSFLLGVVLAVLAILAALDVLGWWTQWLLMSAFWWGAFLRRHQALGLAEGTIGARARHEPLRPQRSLGGRLSGALETRKGWAVANWARAKLASNDAPEPRLHAEPGTASPRASARAGLGLLARNMPAARAHTGERGERGPAETATADPEARERERREQLQRITHEQRRAEAAGDRRRAAQLAARAERVQAEIRSGRATQAGASRTAPRDRATSARPGTQTPGDTSRGRELIYPDPERRRQARLEIDREIALQRDLSRAGGRRAPHAGAMHADEGHSADDATRAPGRTRQPRESSVMRDAREVEAGRKRQLGRERP